MHDERSYDIHKAIEQMTSNEKRDLIDEINRSFEDNHRHHPRNEFMTAEQKKAVLDLLDEVESLPIADEPADGLVASRDHDKILYGSSKKAGLSEEKPSK